MRTSILSSLFLMGIVSSSLVGCAGDATGASEGIGGGNGNGPGGSGAVEEAVLSDNAVPLTAVQVANADVLQDQITFNDPDAAVLRLKEGDTISSASEGKVFIRTITNIQVTTARNGKKVVIATTKNAVLTDIAKHANTHKHIDVTPIEFDISGQKIYQDDSVELTCSNCTFKYTPTFDIGLNVTKTNVNYFGAGFDGDLASQIELTGTAKAGASFSGEIEVFKTKLTFVQTIGVVPIWEDVEISVKVGVEGRVGPKTNVTAGMSMTRRMQGGITYEGGEWSTAYDDESKLAPTTPRIEFVVGGNVKVYVKPEIQVKLYSIGGPFLNVEPFIDFRGQVCPAPATWNASAGFGVNVGASLDFLMLPHLSYSKEVYHKEIPIGSGTLPNLSVASACPETIEIPLSIE